MPEYQINLSQVFMSQEHGLLDGTGKKFASKGPPRREKSKAIRVSAYNLKVRIHFLVFRKTSALQL